MRRLMVGFAILIVLSLPAMTPRVVAGPGDPTAQEAAYIGSYLTLSDMAGHNVGDVGVVYNVPEHGLEWRAEVLGLIGIWDALLAQAKRMDPPLTLVSHHDDLISALMAIVEAGDLFERSINEGDDALVLQGNDKMQAAVDSLTAAVNRVVAFLSGDETPLVTATPRPTRTPLPDPTGTAMLQPSKTPRPTEPAPTSAPSGDASLTPIWDIALDEAMMVQDLSGNRIGFLTVTLWITNLSTIPRTFGGIERELVVTSSDGRTYDEDIFSSAKLIGLTGEWTGDFAPGKTYKKTIVFSIPRADTQVYPEDPSGWVLTYIDELGRSYKVDLGI